MTEPAPGAGSDLSIQHPRNPARPRLGVERATLPSVWRRRDFALVLAQADAGATLFVVPADTPGHRVVRDIGMVTGYQIGGHAEIELTVMGSATTPLGEPGRGLEYAHRAGARAPVALHTYRRARRALKPLKPTSTRASLFGRAWPICNRSRPWWPIHTSTCTPAAWMTLDCAGRMDVGSSVKQHTAP